VSTYHETLEISAHGRGFHEITDRVARVVSASSIDTGICTAFVQHTSAGLCIQENADPSARRDMERWLDRIAPEGHPDYSHTAEGPDDMPAHLKAILTGTSAEIPVIDGRLALGTWQGLYFCEFRDRPGMRKVVVMVR
jgi:secondary thiamine-phosphate synthase enzyme